MVAFDDAALREREPSPWASAGREDTGAVAHPGKGPGHVEGGPDGDAVAEMFGENARVVGEVAGEIAVRPAAAVFEGLGQVPVVEGAEGAESGFEDGVDEAAGVIESGGVGRAGAGGLDARPRDREAVRLQVKLLHDREVFAVAVVVVARDVAGGGAFDFARRVSESVPDGLAFAVGVPGAFDLVGGGGHAPEEVVGESGGGNCGG
jgi:hypothetical protein